jgi:C4-dicarboxylate transporter DctM subunit
MTCRPKKSRQVTEEQAMSDSVSLALVLSVFVALILISVPVSISLAFSGGLGLILSNDFSTSTATIGSVPYSATASYSLTLIPMFILMGLFASHSGMLNGVFDLAQRVLRGVRGGLPAAALSAAVFFGGVSGSSVADAATVGRMSINEMAKRGYDKAFASAVVAAGGTVAILIPPSIVLVLFGVVTGASINDLLLAGIIPGILSGVAQILLIVAIAPRYLRGVTPESGNPERVEKAGKPARVPLSRLSVLGIALSSMLPIIVIGGIYTGTFTANEAGAVGAVASFLLSIIYVGVQRSTNRAAGVRSMAAAALRETGGLTSSVFLLIIGSTIFSQYLIQAGVPDALTTQILSFDIPPMGVVVMFLLVLLVLGCLLDGLSMLLIVAPLAYPVLIDLGYDGVWIGILFVKMIEIGLIHPPLGLNVYVVAGLNRDVTAGAVFMRILPFVVLELFLVAGLLIFPDIATWLPNRSSAN